MKYLGKLTLLAFLIATVYSCDETRQVLNTSSRVELNGSYDVKTVNGNNSTAGQTIIFNGLGKTVSGNAGCNTYNASFTVETFQLSIGEIATTRKSCPDMSKEDNFLTALGRVSTYQKSGTTLSLLDANSNVVITATAMSN